MLRGRRRRLRLGSRRRFRLLGWLVGEFLVAVVVIFILRFFLRIGLLLLLFLFLLFVLLFFFVVFVFLFRRGLLLTGELGELGSKRGVLRLELFDQCLLFRRSSSLGRRRLCLFSRSLCVAFSLAISRRLFLRFRFRERLFPARLGRVQKRREPRHLRLLLPIRSRPPRELKQIQNIVQSILKRPVQQVHLHIALRVALKHPSAKLADLRLYARLLRHALVQQPIHKL